MHSVYTILRTYIYFKNSFIWLMLFWIYRLYIWNEWLNSDFQRKESISIAVFVLMYTYIYKILKDIEFWSIIEVVDIIVRRFPIRIKLLNRLWTFHFVWFLNLAAIHSPERGSICDYNDFLGNMRPMECHRHNRSSHRCILALKCPIPNIWQ